MTLSEDDPLLRRLSATDEAASLALLMQLCRQCPALHAWLSDEFSRDAKVRRKNAFNSKKIASHFVVVRSQ
jgi:hypothetical protein